MSTKKLVPRPSFLPPGPWSLLLLTLAGLGSPGCAGRGYLGGPAYDRPFPLGAVTDQHWETQQTNAEAADFIFFDHEFVGQTAQFAPGAKSHLEQVAMRLEHVPFPIVIERGLHNAHPELDRARRRMVVETLARMGVPNVEHRVVVAPAFAEGFTGVEGASAYGKSISDSFSGGAGRFSGRGAFFR
jgi:uncharacterized membrane protein YgcG